MVLTLARVADVTGGTLLDVDDPGRIPGGPVVADSREVSAGALFAALPGERVDGHAFAGAAIEDGAAAVLASRRCGAPTVLVDDVPAALGRLARATHDALPGMTTIGVTGSSGKTSTKDLITSVVGRAGETVAARESYNNEIGHPLTVLRAEADTRHLVLELSARGPGHISYLAGIAPPRIGAVLNVGTAHLGEFGSREAVARAKGELVEALPGDGVAVLNADDPLVAAMAERTRARVVTFGMDSGATVRAGDVRLDARGRPRFTLRTPAGSARVSLRLFGEHQVGNALVAAAVAGEVGMPIARTAAALGEAVPTSRWRMDVRDGRDGITVINDAYNANPESTAAALRALVTIAGRRRTWAVLGGMAELGEASARAHRETGALLAALGVRGLITVGDEAAQVAAGVRGAGGEARVELVQVADADGALAVLAGRLSPEDVVLVKGSRVAGLERVAEALLADERDEGVPA